MFHPRYFGLFLLLFLAPVAGAQPATLAPPPIYHALEPPEIEPEIEPAAREMLGALSARYEALRSYSGAVRFEIEDQQLMGAREAAERGMRAQLSWQRPDRVRLEGESKAGHFLAVSDGQTVWAQTAARPEVYVRREAGVWAARDAALEVEKMLISIQFFFERGYIERHILTNHDLISLSTQPDAEVDGTLCHVVEARSGGHGLGIIQRFFIAAEAGTLRRLASTIAQGQNRTTFIETHSEIRFNPTLEASTWQFTIPPDAKPLPSFSSRFVPHSLGPNLKIGDALPAFTATTSDGKTLSPADLRGQVVILYFYHPHTAEDAAKLADLQRQSGARGLQVVAVMMDTRREMIPAILEGQPVPYPFLFDPKGSEGAVPTLFGQTGLGWMLLIDREGKLRRVGRDLSDLEFSGDIETLLAAPLAPALP